MDNQRLWFSIVRIEADSFERQFEPFRLRSQIASEHLERRQPTFMLFAEDVKEVGPIIARDLLCRHSYDLKFQLERFPAAHLYPTERNVPAVRAHGSRQDGSRCRIARTTGRQSNGFAFPFGADRSLR